MIEPLPNCFSIWPTALSMALVRSFRSSSGMQVSFGVGRVELEDGLRSVLTAPLSRPARGS